jgi:radical SAM superfamily enzyme YgiQ (UPF0313 family)
LPRKKEIEGFTMRIAIIAPPYPLEEAPAPPLGVSYVAAAFESAGAEVKVIDYIVSRYRPDKLRTELDTFKPDAVGTTSVTMNFPKAVEIIRDVKEINPSIATMMGGPHVTFDAENTLKKHPEIDLLVLGEGEITIMELTPFIEDRTRWPEIRGIAYVDDERVVITEPRGFIQDIDSLPLPSRHLLPLSRYLALGFPVSLITSRGCPNQCIFCQGRRMVGSKVRYRDPMKVVDEIEEIISLGFTRINIADDLFVSKKERAQQICSEIIKRKLNFSWSAFSRVNTVDFDTLHLMHEAGCDTVSFGIESGNPEMLKRIRKGITINQARRAVNLCREVGIMPHASFMVGLPGETHATLRDTQEFAQSLGVLYGYHYLAPFPGTTVRENINRYDLEILTDDWALYDANRAIVRTSGLSPEAIERFVEEYYQEYRDYWEKLEQRYREGTATQEESLSVSGHHRTEFTYRLLSEDIIEEHCHFPSEILKSHPGQEEMLLSEKVTQVTGLDGEVVTNSLKNFVENGYLKAQNINNHISWYWTHNKREDFWQLPLSAT